MNDPQRPVFVDGRWHLYYLYNADHPEGNGTAWFHATSTDLVSWRDEGVAINKYTNGLGDIQTGSVVVDTANTAGFGAGAVVALATQQDDGVQRQSLFHSADGGYTFRGHAGNPVMDHPGSKDWRDPKVMWDARRSQWVMALAEGHKIGFYTSANLTSWTYRSGFERDDLGLLECPELFEMSVDGDPRRTTWVLGTSANGSSRGRTTGYAYWTGSWDGTRFAPTDPEPSWLDSGPDFYAAMTWDDPHASDDERLATRYALGWMNNWAYAGELPLREWSGGQLSVTREITLAGRPDGPPQLRSRPVAALDRLEGTPREVTPSMTATPDDPAGIDLPAAAHRLRLTVAADQREPARQVHLQLADDVTFTVDLERRTASLVRRTLPGSDLPESYAQLLTDTVTVPSDGVRLDILIDRMSVEVFVGGGERTFSALSFGATGPSRVRIDAVGGTARLDDVTLTPMAAAPPQRR